MDLEKALEIYRTCELPNCDEEPDEWLDFVENVCPQCVLSREVEVDHEVMERICILFLEIEEIISGKPNLGLFGIWTWANMEEE